jgi:cell division protease FtsH
MFPTRQELIRHMAVALAGRAAEELAFGPEDVTTGAANDLQKAADIAGRMAVEWGMGPDAGKPFEMLMASKEQKQSGALNLLEQAYKLATDVLTTNRDAWNTMWEMLLQKEALTGEEAEACLSPKS